MEIDTEKLSKAAFDLAVLDGSVTGTIQRAIDILNELVESKHPDKVPCVGDIYESTNSIDKGDEVLITRKCEISGEPFVNYWHDGTSVNNKDMKYFLANYQFSRKAIESK